MDYQKLAKEYVKNEGFKGLKVRVRIDNPEIFVFTSYAPDIMLIGGGPTIIYKKDLRFFHYSSPYVPVSAVKNFWNKIEIEKIARRYFPEIDIQKKYDLTIISVFRKRLLIDKLLDLDFIYVIPEIVGEDIFRIAESYDLELLENRLNELPCVFQNVWGMSGEIVCEVIAFNAEKQMVELSIKEHVPIERESRADRATQDDLKPIW